MGEMHARRQKLAELSADRAAKPRVLATVTGRWNAMNSHSILILFGGL